MAPLTRRTFIACAGSAGLTLPAIGPALVRAAPASSRIRHVSVGAAGKAWGDMHNISRASNVELVAACDVDLRRFGNVAEHFPDARQYQDWREMFEREQFDTVNVSTPDHMHAAIAARALQMDRHLYCQKPLTRWLGETRALMAMAEERPSVVTQMGIQHHSRSEFRVARQILRDKVIGRIQRVHTWSNKGWGGGSGRPSGSDPVPEQLDWDGWVGVAPKRPFVERTYHPGRWRNWRDFGCGLLGDMACHVMDPIVTALELGPPRRVRSEGPAPDVERWPAAAEVRYIFAGTDYTREGELEMTWYDGETLPPAEVRDLLPEDHRLPETGSMLIGEQGAMMLPHVSAPRLYPRERFADYRYPQVDPDHHYHQFIDACRGEREARAPFSYGGRLTQTVLIGTVAQHLPGQSLRWDDEAGRFDVDEANDLLTRPYREGWEAPGLP